MYAAPLCKQKGEASLLHSPTQPSLDNGFLHLLFESAIDKHSKLSFVRVPFVCPTAGPNGWAKATWKQQHRHYERMCSDSRPFCGICGTATPPHICGQASRRHHCLPSRGMLLRVRRGAAKYLSMTAICCVSSSSKTASNFFFARHHSL